LRRWAEEEGIEVEGRELLIEGEADELRFEPDG